MPYNGAGTFTRLFNWVQDKVTTPNIMASRMDAEFDGIATALSNAVTRDGQSTITGDVDFGGHRAKGLADAVAGGDGVSRNFGDARYLAKGGGTGMLAGSANDIRIGWDGTKLLAQVDATLLGALWANGTIPSSTVGNFYMSLPNGLIVQGGSVGVSAGDLVVTLPIVFPNAFYGAFATQSGGNGTTDALSTNVEVTTALNSFSVPQRLVSNGGSVVGSPNPFFWLAIGK